MTPASKSSAEDTPPTCAACGHEWRTVTEHGAEIPSHDISTDGQLWCFDCGQRCQLIAALLASHPPKEKA